MIVRAGPVQIDEEVASVARFLHSKTDLQQQEPAGYKPVFDLVLAGPAPAS